MKTARNYTEAGWTCLEHDDNELDIIDKFRRMLHGHGLTLEESDDECDGFIPVRIVKEKTHDPKPRTIVQEDLPKSMRSKERSGDRCQACGELMEEQCGCYGHF